MAADHSEHAEEYEQKNVALVATVIGGVVLVLGLLGIVVRFMS